MTIIAPVAGDPTDPQWAQDISAEVNSLTDDVDTLQGATLFVRKLDDETVNNNNVVQNDDELALSVVANAVYLFRARLTFTSGTTPDMRFSWTFPSGLTMNYNLTTIAVATAVLNQFHFDQTLTANNEGGAVQLSAMLDGVVVVSSTAGTLQLQWAQITANASNTVMKAGSYLTLHRVA